MIGYSNYKYSMMNKRMKNQITNKETKINYVGTDKYTKNEHRVTYETTIHRIE